MECHWLIGILVLLSVSPYTCSQEQPRDPGYFPGENSEQNRPNTGKLQFYMDSASDCSPIVRDTGDREVTVYGRGALQSGASPLTCELSLRVDHPRDPKRYKVSLLEMDIRDCSVFFYIHDGTKSHGLLGRYGCPANSDTNFRRVLWTSGNQLTFYITRTSRHLTQYSIQIQVHAIRSDTDWDEWPQNPDYNRFFKFEQKWVVVIVGVGYSVIGLVTTLLLAVCYCCIRRDRDKWQKSTFGLGKPLLARNDPSATYKLEPANTRTNDQLHHSGNMDERMAGGSDDDDSVFESNQRLTTQNNYPPHQRPSKSRNIHPRNGKSTRNCATGTAESYAQADDDHPRDTFVEREITIPAKKKQKLGPTKEKEFSSEEGEEESSSDGDDTEKESSPLVSESEAQASGGESSEGEDSHDGKSDGTDSDNPKGRIVYAKPRVNLDPPAPSKPRAKAKPVTRKAARPTKQTPLIVKEEQFVPPNEGNVNVQGQPGYHQPNISPPYHGAPPTSDVPYQAGEHGYHPALAPPPYQVSRRYPRYTPELHDPNYQQQHYQHHGQPYGHHHLDPHNVMTKEPPTYSHLVQRGYGPADGGFQSPVDSHNSLENIIGATQDIGVTANIDSGVEIMRR